MLTDKELDRLRVFANCVMSSPDKIKMHGKIARGGGNLWNGYNPGKPDFELEEAFKFIEDFVRLNPDKFLVDKLNDDNLLTIAEVMRVVAEGEEQNGGYYPHAKAARALQQAALDTRAKNNYGRDEDWDAYPEKD